MLTRVCFAGLLLPITVLLAAAPPELLSRRGAVFTGARTAAGSSSGATLTADGRQVIFVSDAPDLTAVPVDGRWLDVFRRDLPSAQTELVSRFGTNDLPGAGHSLGATVSADGRRIAFLSEANDPTIPDLNQGFDVFVRHLPPQGAPFTESVSLRADGAGAGDGVATAAEISADGRFVLFESMASDLVAGSDTNRATDIFLRDLAAKSTVRLSSRAGGDGAGNAGASGAVMSGDGSTVVWRSVATDLVTPPNPGNVTDLFVWSKAGGPLRQIVVSGTQIPTNRLPVRTFNPVLSADGRYLAFRINTGGSGDDVDGIWWFDLAGGTNAQISATVTGSQLLSVDDASGPVMSADGRTLAFEARTELPSPVIRLWQPDVGLRSMESFQATVPPGGGEPATSEAPVLSADGTKLAFLTTSAVPGTEVVTDGDYRLVVRTLATGQTYAAPVGPDDFAYDLPFPEFSADGRQLLFQSEMILGRQADENQAFDVFLADLGTGALTTVSVAADTANPTTPDGSSSTLGQWVSQDGRFVVFASLASDVLAGDTNGVRDVFRHDRQTGETRLVSRGLGGAYANATSTPLQISPDGRLVLFSSVADNLAPGDTNRLEDVFLADLEAGTVVLVSAKDGEDASSTSRGSSQALMSADGQRVFFLSTARDLVSGPSAGSTGNNLLLREPAQKRTRLLSRDTPGGLTGIQGRVIQFGLTDDGARAYFSAGFSAAADLYEFDLATDLPRRLTTDRVVSFAVAPAGNRLAYISLPAGVPRRLILRELPSGAESVPLDFATPAPIEPLRFSRDGSSLVFVTAGALPAARTGIEDTNSVSDVFHLDVVANVLRLISVGDQGQLGNGGANQPQISRDGRRIVFRSTASNLVAGDANGLADAFLHDLTTRRSTLLSANPATGRPANFLSTTPGLSDDGRFATFVSGASDLVTSDFNGAADVFGLVLPTVAAGDTDLDGMADDWERTHFGGLAQTADADADGDGRSNLDEFIAGTNPTEATSVFRVALAQPGANKITLTWASQPGVTYVIETASALAPLAFQPAGPAVTGDGTVKSATVAVTGETGFLRVRAQR